LEVADDVLDFTLQLLGLAFGFAGCLANQLFGSAARLFCRSGNTVLIHDFFPECCEDGRLIPKLIKCNVWLCLYPIGHNWTAAGSFQPTIART